MAGSLSTKAAYLSLGMGQEANVKTHSVTTRNAVGNESLREGIRRLPLCLGKHSRAVILQIRLKLTSSLRFQITLHLSLANMCVALLCLRTPRLDSRSLHSSGKERNQIALPCRTCILQKNMASNCLFVGYIVGASEAL